MATPLRANNIGGILQGPIDRTLLFSEFPKASVFVDGYFLGDMATDDFALEPDQDTTDLVYGNSPQGTKPTGTVVTGTTLNLSFTISGNSMTIQTIAKLSEIVKDKNDGMVDQGYLTSANYTERPRFAIKIVGATSDSELSIEPKDILNLYSVQLSTENLFSWNASEGKTLEVTGIVNARQFTLSEKAQYPNVPGSCFGYWGDNEKISLPIIDWPDRVPPAFAGIELTNASTIDLTLSRPTTLSAGKDFNTGFRVEFDGGPITFTATGPSETVATDKITLALDTPAIAGQIIKVIVAGGVLQAPNSATNDADVIFVRNTL